MPVNQYFVSYNTIFLSMIWWAVPVWVLHSRFSRVPLVVFSGAFFGGVCALSYLAPGEFLPYLSLFIFFLSLLGIYFWRPGLPGMEWESLFILAYCFLTFFFRWEPSGADPVKWASLAKLILENGIPGDTRPLTAVVNLKAATLGIPLLVAHHQFFVRFFFEIPIERLLSFYQCVSLSLFVFALVQSLRVWFEPKVALRTALFALGIFSVPQQYLGWGGTPTLAGFCFGLFLLAYLAQEIPTLSSRIVYGLAAAFTAYAHPIGVYISGLAVAPLLLWFLVKQKRYKDFFYLGMIIVIGFAPFFLFWGYGVSSQEIEIARNWQRTMAGLLFRPEHSYLYNLYSHLTNVVWSTAAQIGLGVALCFGWRKNEHGWAVAFAISTLVLAVLVDNVRHWWVPLSVLLYPERVAGFWVVFLCLPLAFLVRLGSQRKFVWILFLLAVLFVQQFSTRLYPLLGDSHMTELQRTAIVQVQERVPLGECVKIDGTTVAKWIAPIAFRCTRPFHGLSMSTIEEEEMGLDRLTRWEYFLNGITRNGVPLGPGVFALEKENP